jgi:hypothetical protein
MYYMFILLSVAAGGGCCATNAAAAGSTVDARDDNKVVIADAGGHEVTRRQVMVEVRVPNNVARDGAFAFAKQAIAIEGLELDVEYGAVPMEPTDDMARELEESAEQIYLVRGVLEDEALEALKANDRVVNVFDEGRIEHFDAE